jgi:hypothetical protein
MELVSVREKSSTFYVLFFPLATLFWPDSDFSETFYRYHMDVFIALSIILSKPNSDWRPGPQHANAGAIP